LSCEPQEHKELVAQVAHLAIEAYRRKEISGGRVLALAELLGLAPKRLLFWRRQQKPINITVVGGLK
jgi:hypothetical protein